MSRADAPRNRLATSAPVRESPYSARARAWTSQARISLLTRTPSQSNSTRHRVSKTHLPTTPPFGGIRLQAWLSAGSASSGTEIQEWNLHRSCTLPGFATTQSHRSAFVRPKEMACDWPSDGKVVSALDLVNCKVSALTRTLERTRRDTSSQSRFHSDGIGSRLCLGRIFGGEPGPLHLKMLWACCCGSLTS